MKKILLILALLAYFASVYEGGAIECILCHQSGYEGIPQVNTSLFGVHINVNTTGGSGILTSSDCIACHYSANTSYPHRIPVSIFPVLTYTCEDCHVRGAVTAPAVSNHMHGSNISTAASCSDCHSKTVNIFVQSAAQSAAHYGKSAGFGMSPGRQYCGFCHMNSSSVYRDVMQNQDNSMMSSHTSGIINPFHPAGSADCTGCHGIDRIHGADLVKPVPDSTFCNNCHRRDKLQKDMHAGKVECIRCHASSASDIHNIKYLLRNGSYQSVNASNCTGCHDFSLTPPFFRLTFPTADCAVCHQGRGQDRFVEAPRLPARMNHSTNPASGGLWNGSAPAYWNTQEKSCIYCHGYTVHDANAVGKISSIRSGNALNQGITTTGYWCANCHYQGVSSGNFFYNATAFYPLPPEIGNRAGLVPARASDGTNFFYHSLEGYSDAACLVCHGENSPVTTALFVHNVGKGAGGPDCIACHNSRAGAPSGKGIDMIPFNNSVHKELNGGGNKACWACHGNGTKPSGHPAEYRSPRKCSDDECHSLDQKFQAPMVYSHFQNASLNDNPSNMVNFNVSTNSDCQGCHANSVLSQGRNINSTVSHFAYMDLPDTINCIYCHINEDNSKKWGNATLIYKNRTQLVELDRENNKFTGAEGQTVDIGPDYRLRIIEVSPLRGNAKIELIKENKSVDISIVGTGNYTYEEYLDIENASIKVPVIVINVTGIFKGNNESFIQFQGFRLKRVHPEKKTTSCYSCHVKVSPKIKYKVIERHSGEKDEIFYTEETVNLTDKKVFDESAALRFLETLTDSDVHAYIGAEKKKSLYEGDVWNITEETDLLVRGVDSRSEKVFLQLRTGGYSYEEIVGKGDVFEYTPGINYLGNQPKNVTIFRAKVSGIVQASPRNMVILEDVVALSPAIKKIRVNLTLAGYNTSWLWENFTINIGKIPENFHSPQLFEGRNGGGNCLSCHGNGGFSDKLVFSLGKHDELNGGGNNACYACHGGTGDIRTHPAGYKSPRNCTDCHTGARDNYSSVYIGDEKHRDGLCESCHVSNIHEITALHMTPSVKKITLAKEDNRTMLKASVSAGYKMKIRGARYYIDSPLEKSMMLPEDGVFDSQIEEVFAVIDMSRLSPGKHIVYVEAMERNNKWGVPSSLEFISGSSGLETGEKKDAGMPSLVYMLAALLAAFILRRPRCQ